jgi:uncharacterized caspase-like protein
VIGNSAYTAGALPAPANDAGLVAQTLQAAGFDVVGARDLDGESLHRALRDFIDKAGQSGPDTVAAVYFAGYGFSSMVRIISSPWTPALHRLGTCRSSRSAFPTSCGRWLLSN